MKEWFSEHKQEVMLFVFIFLVSTISFGLGYITGHEGNRAPIIIEKN